MKNNTFCSIITCSALFFLFFNLNAQTPYTVVASGLHAPAGLDVDQYNRLWLVQTGTGKNDGSLSLIQRDGTPITVVKDLPSVFDPAVNELQGAWHSLALSNGQIALVQGEGKTAASGSVYLLNLKTCLFGITPALTLTNPDGSLNRRHPNGISVRQIEVSKFVNNQNIEDSNPYSVAIDAAANLYVADAAANSIVKFPQGQSGSIVATLPDFKNPTTIGPPFVNQVPTRIISRPGRGFFISTLSGFPFLDGKSTIYSMTNEGVIKPYKTGLTTTVDMAVDYSTGDLYVLQLGSFALKTTNWTPNSSKILRITANGSTQVVAEGFGIASAMALDNIYVSETFNGRVIKFDRNTVKTSVPFFSENFNKGIPATWSSVDSIGNGPKFTACDSTCLKAYQDQYTANFYDRGIVVADGVKSFLSSTFRAGTASLVAVGQTNLNTTLTSPPINCSGKDKVFLGFNAIAWGGFDTDNLQTMGQANVYCTLRVSRDGLNWKDYRVFGFGLVDFELAFYDISEVAANQSQVYIQFRRTGPENNAIFVVDDISLLEKAPLRNVTVVADMSSVAVSPKGVHIAHENDNWNPNSLAMTDMGNGLYQGTIVVPQSEKVHYKFINGDSESDSERVLEGCGERNAAGVFGRIALGGYKNETLDVVCFGSCMQCGNLNPKAPLLDCANDPNIIYCENFEGLEYGKLLPQASQWTTNAIQLGETVETATDIPSITGFPQGFTNADGGKALRVQFNFNDAGDSPILNLGNATTGSYQLDYKIYVPTDNAAYISFADLTLNFSDALTLSSFDATTFENISLGDTIAYRKDDWNDISLFYNIETKQVILKVNDAKVFDAPNELHLDSTFLYLAVSTENILKNIPHFFIDDIVYRHIPATQALKTVAKKPLMASISPNPANEKLLITPDVDTEANWQVRLLNNVGQLVSTQKSTGSTPIEMVTQNLNAGVYIVEFQSNNTRWTKKVVIQH
jgi:hypothetical protein